MTNKELCKLMATIRDLSLIPYPAAESDTADPRFYIALGIIAGVASEALDAHKEDRPIRVGPFIPEQ